MPISRRALAILAALLVLPLVVGLALLGPGARTATAQSVPVVSSPNIELVTARPGTSAISGVFSRTAPYFYVSGLDTLTVFDVKDPTSPIPMGKLANAIFENEAMTLGERRQPDGSIRRFLLVSNDLYRVTVGPGAIQRGPVGPPLGQELIVVDVTNPNLPEVVGRVETDTGTHTTACANVDCTYAYTSGGGGAFSVIDLTDLEAPKQVATFASPAATPYPPTFSSGSGHHWNFDGAGVGWHTGSGGTAAFDVSNPLAPRLLTTTDENGQKTPWNDFIHHNSQRPNPGAFRPGQAPSVENGNVALITEEDYANEGDEVECDKAGTFQTWEIGGLDGTPGQLRPLDLINAPLEGGGTSTPAGGFCSAHWFDYHQSGIIAQGYYQQGLRLIDVRNARDLKQFGFFTGTATQVWDAYWAPQRDNTGAAVPGLKTNLVYTVDAVRGVEVFRVTNLPRDLRVSGAEAGGPGVSPGGGGGGGTVKPNDEVVPGGSSDSTVASGSTGIGPSGRPCGIPSSTINRAKSTVTRRGFRIRGIARGRECKVAMVRVAVARKTGRLCRFLQPSGRWGARRNCLRTQYLTARGTSNWTFNRTIRLAPGRYSVWSRAVDTARNVERKAKTRNLIQRNVGRR